MVSGAASSAPQPSAGYMPRPVVGANGMADEVIRAGSWTSLERLVNRSLGLVGFLVLARVLAPADYGLLSYAYVFTGFIALFAELGFGAALVQRPVLSRKDVATAFTASFVAYTGVGVLTLLLAPLLASLTGTPDLRWVLSALSVQFLLGSFQGIQYSLLERTYRFRSRARISAVASAIGLGSAIGAALLGAGVYALVTQVIVHQLVFLGMGAHALRWRPRFGWDRTAFREMAGFGSNVLGLNVLTYANGSTDKFIVGTILGPVPLGLYFVGQRLSSFVLELGTSVVADMSLTTFSRIQDDLPRLRRAYIRMSGIVFTISAPALILLSVSAPLSVPLLLGEQWRATVPLAQAFALLALFSSLASFDRGLLLAAGRGRAALLVAVFVVAVNCVVAVVFSPRGLVPLAVALTVAAAAVLPIRLWNLHRSIGLDLGGYLRGMAGAWTAASAAAVTGLAIVFSRGGTTASASVTVVASLSCLAVYGAVMALLGRSLLREVAGIATTVVHRMRKR